MSYDNTLADRMRKALRRQASVTEKAQFGGVAFMVRGNVACGVIGNEMMVRVGPEQHDKALMQPHARPFDKTGRPSKGWVMVGAQGLTTEADLKKWIRLGVTFAKTLPAK